ncbi:MAG: DUF559 domain-containing protein [Gammaproteobacteria bacterium]|nr:DUF559 domain-containing protein [Gammaproteobacteria bacterium]
MRASSEFAGKTPLSLPRGERVGVRGERGQHKTVFARKLRQESSDAEQLLWWHLRNRRLHGWKFRRQRPIGSCVTEFYCANAGLVIEVDGGQHAERQAADRRRTEYFSSLGIQVLRFCNNEMLLNTDVVLERIVAVLGSAPSPQPSPKGERGEGEISHRGERGKK